MSLPRRNDRAYLEITKSANGVSIAAKHKHATDLSALLIRHGIAHVRQEDIAAESVHLRFVTDSDRAKIAEVLESYKNITGS